MLMPDRLMPGTSAIAWAHPIPNAAPKPRPSSRFVWRPSRSAAQEDAGADHERQGHEGFLPHLLLEEVVERDAHDHGGREGRRDEPRQLAIGVARNERSRSVARPAGTRRTQSRQK